MLIIMINIDFSVTMYTITVPVYFWILISKLTAHDRNKLPAFD